MRRGDGGDGLYSCRHAAVAEIEGSDAAALLSVTLFAALPLTDRHLQKLTARGLASRSLLLMPRRKARGFPHGRWQSHNTH
jgi:hypothetical protein